MRASNLAACAIVTVMLGAIPAEAQVPCTACQNVTVRFFKAIGASDCSATPKLKVPKGLEKFYAPGYHFFDIHRNGTTAEGTLGVDHQRGQVISFVFPRSKSPVSGKLLAFQDIERLVAGRLLATLDAPPPGWVFRCHSVSYLTDGVAGLHFEPAKEVSNIPFAAPFNAFVNVCADTGEVRSGGGLMPAAQQLEQLALEFPSPTIVNGAVAKLQALPGFPKKLPVIYTARMEGAHRDQGLVTWVLTATPDRRQNNAVGQSWLAQIRINKSGFTQAQMVSPLDLLKLQQNFTTVFEEHEPEAAWNRLVGEAARGKPQGAGVGSSTRYVSTEAAKVVISAVEGTVMTGITQHVNMATEVAQNGSLLRNLALAAAGLGLIVLIRARLGKHGQAH